MIKFGTDGWRAIMADDFTFGNVEIVVQAIANYLKNTNRIEKGIVIGYDQRFLSDHFARRAAEVLMGNDLKVYLGKKVMPTPVTAFAITLGGYDGALMFTASHNPPEYNGIKFIPHYAGPALPEITNAIEIEVKKVLDAKLIMEVSIKEGEKNGLLHIIDPMEAYLTHIEKLLDTKAYQKCGLKVLLNPMHGAGVGYVSRVLEKIGCKVKEVNNYRDPLFGGTLPEPTGEVLKDFCEQVRSGDYDLGLALDGDADRFGIIDRDGTYIRPNQVLALLLDHLYNRGVRGPVARTVATTHMLDAIAAKFGEKVIETAVGFKYMGAAIRDQGAILGGEESGGLSIKGHIPEKDGILACCLMAEIMAIYGKSFNAMFEDISVKYGNFISERLDQHYDPREKEVLIKRIKELNLEEVAGYKVKERFALDGSKLVFVDGSWCLIRPSGTEPLIRIYTESASKEIMRKIQQGILAHLGLVK